MAATGKKPEPGFSGSDPLANSKKSLSPSPSVSLFGSPEKASAPVPDSAGVPPSRALKVQCDGSAGFGFDAGSSSTRLRPAAPPAEGQGGSSSYRNWLIALPS